jgi:peptide subunit release factor RF-3
MENFDMDDALFMDVVSDAMKSSGAFEKFLAPEIIQRTRGILTDMRESIASQIFKYRDNMNEEWRTRAVNKMRIVENRLKDIETTLQERSGETGAESMKKFAERLAVALEQSDKAFVLDVISFGELSAAEWLDSRLAERVE